MEKYNSQKSKIKRGVNKIKSSLIDPNGEIAQEMYRKNLELAQTNRTLSLLRTIDNLVLQTDISISQLADGVASALVENTNYVYSGVFITTSRSLPLTLEGFGCANKEVATNVSNKLKSIFAYKDDGWINGSDKTLIIDSKLEVHKVRSLFKSGARFFTEVNASTGANTMCAVKLVARNRLVGVLVVGLTGYKSQLNVNEIEYLGRIGESTGLAIDNKLLFEENQSVLRKLKHSNEKLRALDEAKDEFISMASHQLRTPLTSVKGYVSMVLEGDAGRITQQQKDLLNQAFTSSQRMVYLIADLLNVSRLKTGKFVIETTDVDLSEVVQSEVLQLSETAKARSLILSYKKPESFPVLQLDETKIRQVIMNFIDNALYYTPSGGQIEVLLEHSANKVEFKVIDNGLGVPKSEQPHLFTKFYRAENAKKARPDGTGLGLFMAKKVIVSQGGSLLFSSKEGEGSTFGFSFPYTKSEVKKT